MRAVAATDARRLGAVAAVVVVVAAVVRVGAGGGRMMIRGVNGRGSGSDASAVPLGETGTGTGVLRSSLDGVELRFPTERKPSRRSGEEGIEGRD